MASSVAPTSPLKPAATQHALDGAHSLVLEGALAAVAALLAGPRAVTVAARGGAVDEALETDVPAGRVVDGRENCVREGEEGGMRNGGGATGTGGLPPQQMWLPGGWVWGTCGGEVKGCCLLKQALCECKASAVSVTQAVGGRTCGRLECAAADDRHRRRRLAEPHSAAPPASGPPQPPLHRLASDSHDMMSRARCGAQVWCAHSITLRNPCPHPPLIDASPIRLVAPPCSSRADGADGHKEQQEGPAVHGGEQTRL